MSICLFLTFRSRVDRSPDAAEMAKLDGLLRATPRLLKALLHTPARADDPYLDDGPPPQLVLQLYFASTPTTESWRWFTTDISTSRCRAYASSVSWPDADVTQQAMLVRSFAVPEPTFGTAADAPFCTYRRLRGEAEDLNAWRPLFRNHTKHMASLPGIRELEVYTRLDWVSSLPWPRVNFMQRNKVAFDSADALTHALNSPVRHEMRACFKTFPPFTGAITHHTRWRRGSHPHLRWA